MIRERERERLLLQKVPAEQPEEKKLGMADELEERD